jgi:apolipoprotein N-acyltransferase
MAPGAAPVSALPPAACVTAAALRALSRVSMPLLLVALLRASDPPLTPIVLAEALFALALVPELCARLVLGAFAAEARIEGGVLHVAGSWRRLEIACRGIERVRPWRLPLPSPGVTLDLGPAGRLRLALPAPDALLAALAQVGVTMPAPDLAPLAFARARATHRRRWWERPLARVGLASLLPGAVGFHAHQHIAFGSWLGEYYLMGLGAWLASAGRYWLTSALYLVLWAGCFRAALETLAWLASQVAPRRAEGVRRLGEHTTSALYYASIPLLLAARFLA